jgi:hypothetical protein
MSRHIRAPRRRCSPRFRAEPREHDERHERCPYFVLNCRQVCEERTGAGPLAGARLTGWLWLFGCLLLRQGCITCRACGRATFPASRLLRSPLTPLGRQGSTMAVAQVGSERGLARQPTLAGRPQQPTNASPALVRRLRRPSKPRRFPSDRRPETSPTSGQKIQELGTRRADPESHRGHTSETDAIASGYGAHTRTLSGLGRNGRLT